MSMPTTPPQSLSVLHISLLRPKIECTYSEMDGTFCLPHLSPPFAFILSHGFLPELLWAISHSVLYSLCLDTFPGWSLYLHPSTPMCQGDPYQQTIEHLPGTQCFCSCSMKEGAWYSQDPWELHRLDAETFPKTILEDFHLNSAIVQSYPMTNDFFFCCPGPVLSFIFLDWKPMRYNVSSSH